jgi:hypothetical protein
MSNETYKSAEQVAADGVGKPYVACLVSLYGETRNGIYVAKSSYEGCATAWTYRDRHPGTTSFDDITIRISPLDSPKDLSEK